MSVGYILSKNSGYLSSKNQPSELTNIETKEEEFKSPYPNLCNYRTVTHRDSSKRDVVLFSADKMHPGLELAVKSLRSAGSLCRIVILSAQRIPMSMRTIKVMKNLGVEIIDNCTNRDTSRPYVPHLLRYEFEQSWLQEHKDEVDRVFHADVFDVYFQKDPFGPEISKDKLLFVAEPHQFRSCGWNLAWMTNVYGHQITHNYKHRYIICSGSIIGGSQPYFEFLNLLINQPEWKTKFEPSLDQPIVNHLVYSGTLKNHDIKYNVTGCNGDYLTFQWCLPHGIVPFDSKGRIMSYAGTVPAFVHQYNRNETLKNQLYEQCKDNGL